MNDNMSEQEYRSLEKEVQLDDLDFSDLEAKYAVNSDFG